jgi:rod shape determining protein RodA
MLAFLLSQKNQHVKSLLQVMPIMLWVGLPFFLVFRQPDLGTSIMFILIFISMAFWGNISPKIFLELISPLMSIVLVHFLPWGAWVSWTLYLMGLGFYLYFTRTHWVEFVFVLLLNVAAAVVSPLLWMSLKDYQQARILSFINPGLDPLGQGIRYHAQQAATAIGSGGLWGKGLFDGTLSRLGFIPEQHTDFIFSLICEEVGFVGAVLILVLFILIIYRGLRIAANSKDTFSSLVALGVVAMIGMHALINMGMCVGIFPVVGVPLPLISYGGNSLFIHFCALGILENIHSDHQRYYL